MLHLDPQIVEARVRHRAVDVGVRRGHGAADDLLATLQLQLRGVEDARGSVLLRAGASRERQRDERGGEHGGQSYALHDQNLVPSAATTPSA
jgi:hypothetical protein